MARRTIRSSRFARKERHRKVQRLFLLCLAVFFVIAGLVYVLSRPAFRIQQTLLTGVTRAPEEAVRALLSEKLSGEYFGFIPKAHIIFYPRAAIRESLLLRFPSFSRVSLSLKNLAALQVAVREREPEALWCVGERACFLLDGDGVAFEEADSESERLYYRLEKAATTSPIGRTVIPPPRLAALFAFLKELEQLSLESRRVTFSAARDMEVALSDGARLWLREDNYARALANLRALLQNEALPRSDDGLAVSYIDLRYGNKIYFKPK